MAESVRFCGVRLRPGEAVEVELTVSELYTARPLGIPVRIVRGLEPGPTLFVTAAVHGDEINGTEIIRELLYEVNLTSLKGMLVCVPVVNVYGFLNHTRYLPDRRDLNRAFPGHARGSMAARVAHTVFRQIVSRCDAGIDLHTASTCKVNLPHVRGALTDPRVRRMARAFGTEIMLDAGAGSSSLRGAAAAKGIPVLTFEGGEPLRFERHVVEKGLLGILNVMSSLGMIARTRVEPLFRIAARRTSWVRAERGGILDLHVKPGSIVHRGEEIATNTNPFGRERNIVKAPFSGYVIGATTLPSVSPGDAIVHLVRLTRSLRKIEELMTGRL